MPSATKNTKDPLFEETYPEFYKNEMLGACFANKME